MKVKMPKGKDGFTLLEILIVIAIIGIIAAIAFPQFSLLKFKGFMGMVRTDAKNVHTAVISWVAENPGSAIPAISSFTGPGILPNFGAAVISDGVTISVSDTGDVTASHQSLAGSLKILFIGATKEDTLAPPY